ncbi:hypothetical protein FACS189465_0390 [Clostridia bacterium]|nr:hypothetical protein FACS189465_0390 [Clostridia bacterium]
MENKNIEMAFEKIFSNVELAKKFENMQNMEEMYKFAAKAHGGYNLEEFNEYIIKMVKYVEECVANNTLNDEQLYMISGGRNREILNNYKNYGEKVGLLTLASLLTFSSIVGLDKVGAVKNVTDASKIEINENSKKTGLSKSGKVVVSGASFLGLGATVLFVWNQWFRNKEKPLLSSVPSDLSKVSVTDIPTRGDMYHLFFLPMGVDGKKCLPNGDDKLEVIVGENPNLEEVFWANYSGDPSSLEINFYINGHKYNVGAKFSEVGLVLGGNNLIRVDWKKKIIQNPISSSSSSSSVNSQNTNLPSVNVEEVQDEIHDTRKLLIQRAMVYNTDGAGIGTMLGARGEENRGYLFLDIVKPIDPNAFMVKYNDENISLDQLINKYIVKLIVFKVSGKNERMALHVVTQIAGKFTIGSVLGSTQQSQSSTDLSSHSDSLSSNSSRNSPLNGNNSGMVLVERYLGRVFVLLRQIRLLKKFLESDFFALISASNVDVRIIEEKIAVFDSSIDELHKFRKKIGFIASDDVDITYEVPVVMRSLMQRLEIEIPELIKLCGMPKFEYREVNTNDLYRLLNDRVRHITQSRGNNKSSVASKSSLAEDLNREIYRFHFANYSDLPENGKIDSKLQELYNRLKIIESTADSNDLDEIRQEFLVIAADFEKEIEEKKEKERKKQDEIQRKRQEGKRKREEREAEKHELERKQKLLNDKRKALENKSDEASLQEFEELQKEFSAQKEKFDENLDRCGICLKPEMILEDGSTGHIVEAETPVSDSDLNDEIKTMVNPVALPCCGKIICETCVSTWAKIHASCPYCRKALAVEDIFIADDGNHEGHHHG